MRKTPFGTHGGNAVSEESGIPVKELRCGDILFGFILVSIDELPDYNGTGYLFRHELTGMEVYQVVNDDTELFFAYAFRTPPYNDNGVAHIIEHSVLAGSRKYPVRDPFMSLLKGSTNTFMNAMTYADRTIYPAASPLRKDFDNLFDVYTDAVFDPLLREETFWQEGIRLVPGEDGSLRYEGVVFNEMLGDGADHDSIVGRYSVRSLFPDTPYVYESGGDPVQIVKLDYAQFKSFYAQHYHPSNCRLFLYGALEPGVRLEFLENEYLGRYSNLGGIGPSPLAEQWKGPRQLVVTSPCETTAESSSDRTGQASVTLSWATARSEDPLELTTLSTLVDILLGNPGAPLYKAIIESHIGTDLSPESGMSADFRQMPFVVGYKGIDPERAQEAEAFLLETLGSLATGGIARGEVEAALKRQEFRQQEISGNLPNGFRAMSRAMRGWVQGEAPSITIGTGEPLSRLRRLVETSYQQADAASDPSLGYFEKWIAEHIVDNPHRCLLTVVPDTEHVSKQKAQLDRQLDTIRAAMDKKQFRALQERYKRFSDFENGGDTPEAEATVPYLDLEDLPRSIRTIEQYESTIAGRSVWIQPQFTNGIVYIDIAISLDDFDERQMLLMPLYARLIQMTGMGELDYSQVAMRMRSLTGGFIVYLESGTTLRAGNTGREGATMLMVRIKTLERDLIEALRFTGELLRTGNIDDPERLAAALVDIKTEYAGNVMYSGNSYATLRATSGFSPMLQQGEALGGLYQWLFLERQNGNDSAALDELASQLLQLRRLLSDRSRFSVHVTADTVVADAMAGRCEEFLNGFTTGCELLLPRIREFAIHELDFADSTELFRIPSTVSYTALATSSAEPGSPLQTAQVVLANILSGNGLWERIRGKGGAYGVECHTDVLEQVFSFSSYRDPRIAGTFADYRAVLECAMSEPFDRKTIDNALISLIGQDLRPVAPQERAVLGFRRILYAISDEFRAKRRELTLQVGPSELVQAAHSLVEAFDRKQARVVLAGQDLLTKEARMMPLLVRDAVRLPL